MITSWKASLKDYELNKIQIWRKLLNDTSILARWSLVCLIRKISLLFINKKRVYIKWNQTKKEKKKHVLHSVFMLNGAWVYLVCVVGQPLNTVVLPHTHGAGSMLARVAQPLDTQLVSTLQDAATPKPARRMKRGLVRWVNPATSIHHPGNQDGEASWNKADDPSLVNAQKNPSV